MKNQMFGNLNVTFSIPVENTNERLALMEGFHKLNPDFMVAWELNAVNCKGERIKVDIHECEINNGSLEVIEM